MDFSSFSHGQLHSKIWLCEHLEPLLPNNAKIAILGCWHNVMGIIIMVRNPKKGFQIDGIDLDSEVINVADQLTTAWRYEFLNPFKNIHADVNTFDYSAYDVIINTSVEHITKNDWFYNIPDGKLVAIQSMDIQLTNDPIFKITNPNNSIETLKAKYPLSKIIFCDSKKFDYQVNPYVRFCMIGIK